MPHFLPVISQKATASRSIQGLKQWLQNKKQVLRLAFVWARNGAKLFCGFFDMTVSIE